MLLDWWFGKNVLAKVRLHEECNAINVTVFYCGFSVNLCQSPVFSAFPWCMKILSTKRGDQIKILQLYIGDREPQIHWLSFCQLSHRFTSNLFRWQMPSEMVTFEPGEENYSHKRINQMQYLSYYEIIIDVSFPCCACTIWLKCGDPMISQCPGCIATSMGPCLKQDIGNFLWKDQLGDERG
jgi:hypothetical protein